MSKERIEAGTQQRAVLKQFTENFVWDAQKTLSALDPIIEGGGPYSADDLRTYTIHVHGLKNALAIIGEKDIAAVASRLEKAGRDEVIEVISSETPAFLNSLRALVDKFTPKEEAAARDKADIDEPYLHEKLALIKSACEGYDTAAADDILTELREKTWPVPTGELLKAISIYLLHSDFDEVVDAVNKYFMSE